jgi:hypothetical protein
VLAVGWGQAQADPCDKYGKLVARLDTAVNGFNAPVPMHLAQGRQESSCDPTITAWDKGRGFAQMMDATSAQVSKICPEIGPPQPYSVVWSVNAMICYDNWLFRRVKGSDDCEKWGAALTGYNGGLGYVIQSQSASSAPAVWFGVTEAIHSRQSAKNFAYARSYPRKILFQHQPKYAQWGKTVCLKKEQK